MDAANRSASVSADVIPSRVESLGSNRSRLVPRATLPGWEATRSAASLLVIAVLLPEFLAQLRVGLVHGRLTQLARDDVVIAAIRDAGRHRVRAAAAAG